MLRDIVLKELHDLLLSLRAGLTAGTILVLMVVSGLLFVADYAETTADYQKQVEENLDDLRRRASGERGALFQALSWRDQQIHRQPNPLTFMAEGGEKDLPNALQVDAFLLHSFQNLTRRNDFLWGFRKLDWTTVVMVVLSFAAMILSFDGISGERESQMLRLVMSNAVSRHALLLGKYIGITLCLLLLLAVGSLAHLVVVSMSGVVHVTPELLLGAAVGLLLSGLYISIFVWLGLFVSSRCRDSASSLVICLLTWAMVVVAAPSLGGVLASRLADVPDPDRVWQRASEARVQAKEAFDASHPEQDGRFWSGNWSPGENLARALLMDEARERVLADMWTRRFAQARLARDVTRASPAAAFRYAMEGVAGSGLEHCAWFYEQGRRYRETLRDFLVQEYPVSPDHAGDDELRRTLRQIRLSFEEIPRFEAQLIPSREALLSAADDVLLLFLWVTVAFLAAFVSFLRCDVR